VQRMSEKKDNNLDMLKARFDELKGNENVENAISGYYEIIDAQVTLDDDVSKVKENAILELGLIYKSQGNAIAIQELLIKLRPLFNDLPKAKTGKIVRELIDLVSKINGAESILIELCREQIEWTKTEERTFLRLVLETKLSYALFVVKEYDEALKIIAKLLKEVKKLDDKGLLVEIHLLESKIHHALLHLPRARSQLTAARTSAHAIYCPPLLQAELDIQSGILHAEEGDYKTAYSYFYEAYENYNATTKQKDYASEMSKSCLKYMLLSRIMTKNSDEVSNLINGKLAIQYAQPELEVMRSIANSFKKSSLSEFKAVIESNRTELEKDSVVQRHLDALYDNLLEQNLLQIIEPFSVVEISHISNLIQLEVPPVEKKLSQMILDKKLIGILDQANDCLIVYENPPEDELYPTVVEIFDNIDGVIDSLYKRAGKLT